MDPMSDEATERDPVLPTGKAEVASGEVGSGGAEVVSGDVPARAANDPVPAGPSAPDRDADGLELGVAERPTDLPPEPIDPPSSQTRLTTSEPRACPNCTRLNAGDARFCSACGLGLLGDEPAHLPPGADPLVGRVLAGRYRIDEVIGRGGMGVVYRVEHVRMGKLMAVKLLHGDLARDKEVVRRFHREAEAVSKLDHPHTVQVFDFGESDGMTWLVMELLSGRDLGVLLTTDNTMDFGRAARIVWQIAGSVQQAHERGIVHRDLKPENVRILSDRAEPDFVKVMDFGLAKLRETEEQKRASITRDGFLVGTPYYMAPEHIRGDTVDARTDVYALGAMLYKMIAGVPPFWATTPVAVLTKHLTDDAVAPSRRSPRRDLPPEADRIVLRALEKNPADRYQSMNELRDELALFLGSAGSAPKSGPLEVPKVELATESGRKVQVATRDDVDRFERGLATQDVLGRIFLVLLAVLTAGVSYWAWGMQPVGAPTMETEPNDIVAAPGEVWIDAPLEGQIGQRLDTLEGDVDVYEVVGLSPTDRFVRLDVGGLPNVDLALELFVHGRPDPVMVIDGAGLGAPERVPVFPIDPSTHYVVRVRESLVPGRYPTENVSDHYLLAISRTAPGEGEEIEPNDGISRGAEVSLDAVRAGWVGRGYIGWRGDVDTYCVPDGTPSVVATVSGLPALDLVLDVRDRVSGSESHVDVAGLGEGERAEVSSGHPFCVSVSAAEDRGGRSDPDRTYELRLGTE